MAQTVKNLPAMWEIWVRSLDGEDPLEEGTAIHSRILARRIPWTEEPGEATVHGVAESGTTEGLTLRGTRPICCYPTESFLLKNPNKTMQSLCSLKKCVNPVVHIQNADSDTQGQLLDLWPRLQKRGDVLSGPLSLNF